MSLRLRVIWGFREKSKDEEYCRALIGPVQALPIFPKRVEHRKPNFPTRLAATVGFSCPSAMILRIRRLFLRVGLGSKLSSLSVSNLLVQKTTPRICAASDRSWLFSASRVNPSDEKVSLRQNALVFASAGTETRKKSSKKWSNMKPKALMMHGFAHSETR